MSDEFCAGVQILLKRMESNPDEFRDHNGKWESVTRAVFARKEGNHVDAWAVRALNDAEVDALYAGAIRIYRPEFDSYVMKNVLDESNENLKYKATERYVQGFTVTAGGSGGSGQVKLGGGSGSNAALRKMVDEQIQQKKQHRKESALSRIKRELGL